MSDPSAFDKSDWADLESHEKNALRKFSRVATDFEALAKAAGVGQKSMDDLMAKGLAVEGEPSRHGRTFKITEKGWLAVEWLSGRRPRV